MRPHFTNEVGTVGRTETSSREEVTNSGVGIIPISPSQEIGEFRSKAAPAQYSIAKRAAMHKEDLTIPQCRLLFFLVSEISRNLITLCYGKFPIPRFG